MADRRPTVEALTTLSPDDWSGLLAVALPVVRQLPEVHVDAQVKRVAALPPGRLAGGRSRGDLAAVLVRGPVWDRVLEALPQDAPRPWDDPAPVVPPQPVDDEALELRARVEHLEDREHRLGEKLADLRDDVAALRRQRDGAVARATRAEEAERDALAAEREARAAAARAEEEAAAAEERVDAAVARARRRDDSEVARLEEDLAGVRRTRDELRQQRDRLLRQLEAATQARPPEHTAEASPRSDRNGRRGRPSRLPQDISVGTRRAAEWLVADGRVLLVDGYNVTRTQRGDLTFAAQRRWLEQATGALAQRRHVEATIVWDAARGRPSTRRTPTGLTVRFTREGVSADDELVLHLELAVAPETPVVVVTDDVGLRARLEPHGVDLLDTRSFAWLL